MKGVGVRGEELKKTLCLICVEFQRELEAWTMQNATQHVTTNVRLLFVGYAPIQRLWSRNAHTQTVAPTRRLR